MALVNLYVFYSLNQNSKNILTYAKFSSNIRINKDYINK